jgi:hypothetical protein
MHLGGPGSFAMLPRGSMHSGFAVVKLSFFPPAAAGSACRGMLQEWKPSYEKQTESRQKKAILGHQRQSAGRQTTGGMIPYLWATWRLCWAAMEDEAEKMEEKTPYHPCLIGHKPIRAPASPSRRAPGVQSLVGPASTADSAVP